MTATTNLTAPSAVFGASASNATSNPNHPQVPTPSPTPPSGPSIRFDFLRKNVVEIRLRNKLTKDEFIKLKGMFDTFQYALVEDSEETIQEKDEMPSERTETRRFESVIIKNPRHSPGAGR